MSGSFYICVQHPISVGTEGSQVSDSHISGKWGNILTKGCVYFLYSPISGSFDLLICSHQVRDQSFFIPWARVEGMEGWDYMVSGRIEGGHFLPTEYHGEAIEN